MTIESIPRNGSRSAVKADGERRNVQPVAALKFSATLGQIALVLMRSRQHKYSFLSDLEWLVMPAIATNQFMIAEQPDSGSGLSLPVAVAMWSTVSNDVDARISGNPRLPIRLKPEEWTSGPIPWLMEAVGDPRAVGGLVRTLVERRFPVDGIKTIGRSPEGAPTVRILKQEAMGSEHNPYAAEAGTPS